MKIQQENLQPSLKIPTTEKFSKLKKLIGEIKDIYSSRAENEIERKKIKEINNLIQDFNKKTKSFYSINIKIKPSEIIINEDLLTDLSVDDLLTKLSDLVDKTSQSILSAEKLHIFYKESKIIIGRIKKDLGLFNPRSGRVPVKKSPDKINKMIKRLIDRYSDEIKRNNVNSKRLFEIKSNLKNPIIEELQKCDSKELDQIDIKLIHSFKSIFNKITAKQDEIRKNLKRLNCNLHNFDTDKKLAILRNLLERGENSDSPAKEPSSNIHIEQVKKIRKLSEEFDSQEVPPTKKQKKRLTSHEIPDEGPSMNSFRSERPQRTRTLPLRLREEEEIFTHRPSLTKPKPDLVGDRDSSQPVKKQESKPSKRTRDGSQDQTEGAISHTSPLKKQKSIAKREKQVRERINAIQIPSELPRLSRVIQSIQSGKRKFAHTPIQSKHFNALWKSWKNPPSKNKQYHSLKSRFEAYKKSADHKNESRVGIFDSLDPELNHLAIAIKEIQAGEIIGEYTGEVKIDSEDADQRYIFNVLPTDKYEQQFLKEKEIDNLSISGTIRCNHTAFVSHNPDQDANIDAYCLLDKEGPHIIYQAKRTISKGEPLTIDYGDDYWEAIGVEPVKIKGKATFV